MTTRKFPERADGYGPRVRRDIRLAAALEQLARLEPGGAPGHPIDVESSSQLEPRALSTPCLRCDGPYRLDEHLAEVREGQRVRVLRVRCGHCGARRTLFFRVLPVRSS